MANEISINSRLNVNNGSYKANFQPTQLQFDQTAQGAEGGILNVNSTASVVLPATALTTRGWLAMLNLDDTNWVNWGSVASTTTSLTNPAGRLEPGEPALFRTSPATVLSLRASSTGAADCKVQYLWLED